MRISIEIFRVLLVATCVVASHAYADMYPLDTSYVRNGQRFEDRGTAVCIARTDRGSLLVTAAHNLRSNPSSVWVSDRRQWLQATNVQLHPTEDLATLEVAAVLEVTPLADVTPIGEAVTVDGYGPRLNKTGEPLRFAATIVESNQLRGDEGQHAIPGDSGGPVLYQTATGPAVVGIVTEHEGATPARYRTQFASRRARTGFVPASTVVAFVQTQYGGCPNGVCPIRIRPQIQQPMIGIGIPTGPPRIVNTIEPQPRNAIQRPCETIQGPQGPSGPPGRDGRSVTREEVEACVNAWLEANAAQLQGPPGPAGPAGPSGPAGSAANVTSIDRRLSELERRPFRIILSSDGQILDDESYAPGEPVVLDLKRLRSVSDAE